jgi:DNA-binding NarL/FixJ family response regulator
MTLDLSNQVLVLCDHDALYAAIELKLSSLPEVRVMRIESNPPAPQATSLRPTDFDLIILATLSPAAEPLSMLSELPQPCREAETPVLIISEQPSRPESDDKITFLNFPFDLDELNHTVMAILNENPKIST